MSTVAASPSVRHPWLTWRAHAWWAALILLPFLVPHAVLATGGDAIATTLVLYGPAFAAMWIAGHLVLASLRRERSNEPALVGS